MAHPSSVTVLHADPNHPKLQLTVVLLLLAFWLLVWWALNGLWTAVWPTQTNFKFILNCTGSLILALALMWVVENQLRRVWHSGRKLQLDPHGIELYNPDQPPLSLPWQAETRQLRWHFVLKGYKRGGSERLLPEGSICLAVQLQQPNGRLIVYSYFSAKAAQPWLQANGRGPFYAIVPAAIYPQARRFGYFSPPRRPDKIPADILAGTDGRYWLAEQRRWQEGFELSTVDFEKFMQQLNQYGRWDPSQSPP